MEDKDFLINAVKTFFKEDDWKYEFHEEGDCFTGGLSLGKDSKINSVKFFVFVHDDHLTCYHVCSINAQKSNFAAVGEFLHRANYGLNRGNFEMDYRDGEIRYKHWLSINAIKEDSFTAMRLLMLIGAQMFSTYGDGLLAVIFGFKTPEDAITECEQDDDED